MKIHHYWGRVALAGLMACALAKRTSALPPQNGVQASLEAVSGTYAGPCPAIMNFSGSVTLSAGPPQQVQYKIVRSDGAEGPVQTLNFPGPGTQKITDTWTVDQTMEGWEQIQWVAPQPGESGHADFSVRCGIDWSRPKLVLTGVGGSFSNLVIENGVWYVARAVDANKPDLWLMTNKGGSWKAYRVAPDLTVVGPTGRAAGLAVRNGVAYILFDADGTITLASNPSGDPQGPWNLYPVPSTAEHAGKTSVAIAGDTLAVAISATNRDKGDRDIFVSTVPLSALRASSGGSLPWQTLDVTQGDKLRDDNPSLAADDGSLDLAWARNVGIEVEFARGLPGGPGGLSWPSPPVLVATTDNHFDALQLAASHGRAVMGRMFQMKDGIETWGSITAGGAWTSQMLGLEANSPVYDEVGAAFSRCGASLSYNRYVGIPNAGEYKVQPTVATFAGGQWSQQDIGPIHLFASWAEIAPTDKGLGLVFQTSKGPEVDLWTAEGTCYQSPRKLPAVGH